MEREVKGKEKPSFEEEEANGEHYDQPLPEGQKEGWKEKARAIGNKPSLNVENEEEGQKLANGLSNGRC